MRQSRGFRYVGAALAIAGIAACARWAEEPRWGSLRNDPRKLEFAHNIELLEITNGMRVALIQDARTNLATIDMRYLVGSAEDPPGRTGMAHLVEHLLFELRATPGGPTLGNELGDLALYMNATTSWDRTHYTATVPIAQLDAAIALEGRRMAGSCDQLDEATFVRERAVVLAEHAQRSTPLTGLFYQILAEVYGPRHPYARPLDGKEIAQATRAEVCAFIAAHYAPDRAILVVTGPFGSDLGKKIGRTFGPIQRRSTQRRTALTPANLHGTSSRHTADVARPTVLVFLPDGPWGGADAVPLAVGRARLAGVLSTADSERPWITETAVYSIGGERGPVLVAQLEVTDAEHMAQAVDEVFSRAAHLFENMSSYARDRLVDVTQLQFVSSWDDLAERGSWIADYLQYTDHNWFMLQEMRAAQELSTEGLTRGFSQLYVPGKSHIAYVTPSGNAATEVEAAVPTGTHALVPWRAPVDEAEAERPLAVVVPAGARIESYELGNGLRVLLAPDIRSPVVDARLVFPVGRAHEPAARYGVASAAAYLLDHDFEGRYPMETINRLLAAMSNGTVSDADVGETTTTFSVRGLAEWGDWHVWTLSWLLDQGRYNQASMDAMRRYARELAAAAARDPDDEVDRDALLFGERLFGKGHPYSTPTPETGAAYLKLGASDLMAWKRAHYKARGATLIVSGAFDAVAMRKEIDELFGPWSADAPEVLPAIPPPAPAAGPSWLADDDTDARQARLTIGFAAVSDPETNEAARLVLEVMLDDALRDIREGMGASYGVYARYLRGAAGSALLVSGAVDEAQAGEAARRILAAIASFRDGQVDHRAAFVRARKKALAQALARTGGASAVASRLEALASRGQKPDHDRKLAASLSVLTAASLAEVAAADLATARMVVQVRGQPAVVNATFEALGVTPERW